MFKSGAPTDFAPGASANTPSNGNATDAPQKKQKLEDLKNQCSELISELDSDEDPEAVIKKHICEIAKYNELQDIALGLVTMIADQRQLRTTDILEEMKEELESNE